MSQYIDPKDIHFAIWGVTLLLLYAGYRLVDLIPSGRDDSSEYVEESPLLEERCAACGSYDAALLAIEGKPGVGKETLLIQSQCKVCGARQFFAPLVVPEGGELKSFQRVGKVEGKALST